LQNLVLAITILKMHHRCSGRLVEADGKKKEKVTNSGGISKKLFLIFYQTIP